MKFQIKNESKKRMRIHLSVYRMSYEEADILQYYLSNLSYVQQVKVYDRTCDAVILYSGKQEERKVLLKKLQEFQYANVLIPEQYIENSGRAMNAQYRERLVWKVAAHYARRWMLPVPVQMCYQTLKALPYMAKGIRCLWNRKMEVALLDGTAIGVSVLRGDYSTADSVMFLLGIGEILGIL